MGGIRKLTIEGFKSIRQLKDFELRPLNILIGSNGAGKSNFVGFFKLLRALIEDRIQAIVSKSGGADSMLHFGPKITPTIKAKLAFGQVNYFCSLGVNAENQLYFESEAATSAQLGGVSLGNGHFESRLRYAEYPKTGLGSPQLAFEALYGLCVYHFYDTSETAGVRRWCAINDNEYLRPDASNLAAFLYNLQLHHPETYAKIRGVVRLAAPFFDDFKLRRIVDNPEMIQLEWTQKGSDYPFRPSQLSDGTLRFICLATALLQPEPPGLMLFDEPELGLHPYALTLLANLFKQVSQERTNQVIVSTQSALLLNEFEPEDIIVVERTNGESTFQRLDSAHLSEWLGEYGLGELWQKNILGGRPRNEALPLPPRVDIDAVPAVESSLQ